MNILFLDDDHTRHTLFKKYLGQPFHPVFTAEEAIQSMKTQKWDAIFLDHDLGGEIYVNVANKNTGSEVVRQMIQDDQIFELQSKSIIIVHSFNASAALFMAMDLNKRGYDACLASFGSDRFKEMSNNLIDVLKA